MHFKTIIFAALLISFNAHAWDGDMIEPQRMIASQGHFRGGTNTMLESGEDYDSLAESANNIATNNADPEESYDNNDDNVD